MSRKLLPSLLGAVALTATAALPALAQSTTTCPDGQGGSNPYGNGGPGQERYACQQNATATATVGDVLSLTLSTNGIDLGKPGKANYGALDQNAYLSTATGLPAAGRVTVSVMANRSFRVNVMTTQAVFSYSDNNNGFGNPQKPVSDVLYSSSNLQGTGALSYSNGPGAPTDVPLMNVGQDPSQAPQGQNSAGQITVLYNNGGTSMNSADVTFKTKWAYERDVPGTYSVPVVFVLATR